MCAVRQISSHQFPQLKVQEVGDLGCFDNRQHKRGGDKRQKPAWRHVQNRHVGPPHIYPRYPLVLTGLRGVRFMTRLGP